MYVNNSAVELVPGVLLDLGLTCSDHGALPTADDTSSLDSVL